MHCKIQGWISHMGIWAHAIASFILVKSTVLLNYEIACDVKNRVGMYTTAIMALV